MTSNYEMAFANARAASAKYRPIQKAYLKGEISFEIMSEARKELERANSAFDIAFATEQAKAED